MKSNNRLREIRKIHNLTQAEVGKMLGYSQSHYASYELGTTELTESIILKLADFYKVSTDYLLGRDNENSKKVKDFKKVELAIKLLNDFLEN